MAEHDRLKLITWLGLSEGKGLCTDQEDSQDRARATENFPLIPTPPLVSKSRSLRSPEEVY